MMEELSNLDKLRTLGAFVFYVVFWALMTWGVVVMFFRWKSLRSFLAMAGAVLILVSSIAHLIGMGFLVTDPERFPVGGDWFAQLMRGVMTGQNVGMVLLGIGFLALAYRFVPGGGMRGREGNHP